MLLCNAIGACVEEVDDNLLESGMGKIPYFTLKKKSALSTVAH